MICSKKKPRRELPPAAIHPARLLLIAALLLLASASMAICAPETLPVPTPEALELCKKRYFETLQRLNDALKSRNILPVEADSAQIRSDTYTDYPIPIEVLHMEDADVFEMSFVTGQPRREATIQRVYRHLPPGPSATAPPGPGWSEAQAVQEARFWHEAVLGAFPYSIGKPSAKYSKGGGEYNSSAWWVEWPRVDAQGHRFVNDSVLGIINEKSGVAYLYRSFPSSYAEGQKVIVNPVQAAKTAGPGAKKLVQLFAAVPPAPLPGIAYVPGLPPPSAGWTDWQAWKDWCDTKYTSAWASFRSWMRGYTVTQIGTPKLLIVNPNHVLDHDPLTLMPPYDIVARLAWVVNFSVINPDGKKATIEMWIDTETGSAVGGTGTWD